MGNTLAPVQRDLSLVDSDSASDAKEILDCLKDMARDRIVVFYEKIGYAPSLLSRATHQLDILTVTVTAIKTSSLSTRPSRSSPLVRSQMAYRLPPQIP